MLLSVVACVVAGFVSTRAIELVMWNCGHHATRWALAAALIVALPIASWFLVVSHLALAPTRVFAPCFLFGPAYIDSTWLVVKWLHLLYRNGRAAVSPMSQRGLSWQLLACLYFVTAPFMSIIMLPGALIFCVANVVRQPVPLDETTRELLKHSSGFASDFADRIRAVRADGSHPIELIVNWVMNGGTGGDGALAFALFNIVFTGVRRDKSLRISGSAGRRLCKHEVCHCLQQYRSPSVQGFLAMYLAQFSCNILFYRANPTAPIRLRRTSGEDFTPGEKAYYAIAAENQAFSLESDTAPVKPDHAIDGMFYAVWF